MTTQTDITQNAFKMLKDNLGIDLGNLGSMNLQSLGGLFEGGKAAEQSLMAMMPEEMKHTVTDKFGGRPTNLLGFIGNLGVSGRELADEKSPGAISFRRAMHASGALAEQNWVRSMAGIDTIMKGMFDLYKDGKHEELAAIQRSIAAQGPQGLAALTTAMNSPSQWQQNDLWEKMQKDPDQAGQILLQAIPEDQRDKDVATLKVHAYQAAPSAQTLQTVTDELDGLRDGLTGAPKKALENTLHESATTMFGTSPLANTLAYLPEAERQKFYAMIKENPESLKILEEHVKADGSFLAMQTSDIQANPTAVNFLEKTIKTTPDQARQNLLMRAGMGLQNPDGSTGDASTFVQQFLSGQGGFDINHLPPWLHQILGAGNYFAANLFGGKLLGMGSAFVQEFMDGGTTTNHSRYDQAIAAAQVSKWERVLGISGGKTGQIRAMDADGKIVETAANDTPAAARSPASAPGTTPEQQQKPGG